MACEVGAWDKFPVDEAKLLGYESFELTDRDTGEIRDDAITNLLVMTARNTVRELAVVQLQGLIPRYTSEDALFDTIAGTASVSDRIGEALCLAVLHHYFRGEVVTDGGVSLEKADYYWMRLTAAVRALAGVASQALTTVDTPQVLEANTGSFAVRRTIDIYGYGLD